MAAEKKGISVVEIISDSEKGVYHWDYYEWWQEFKKGWSQDDRIKWDKLRGRLHKDVDGKRILEPPLTHEEKIWAMDMMRRAMERGFC